MKLKLALLVLVLSSLACGQIVTTPTPTPAPAAAPLETPTQVQTPIPSPTPTLALDVARVVSPVVNVRAKPDGDVIGTLLAGDAVTVIGCDGNWCQIADPAGYVWAGCLSVESNLKCEAKP